MASTVGVIVEYNPFHHGHAYHLEQARKTADAEAVVAVMSGNWLQRGEPALMNKWARAETALLAGVDLVIELPIVFSTQPAEWFAFGAVSALEATGIVDSVCFGSESGDIGSLIQLAQRLQNEPASFQKLLHDQLKRGLPYPAAYAAAVERLTAASSAALLAKPNNSLGFHYLLSLLRLGSPIQPLTIQRVKAEYHDSRLHDAAIASATAIRNALLGSTEGAQALPSIKNYVPDMTYRIMQREWELGRAPMHWERYRQALFHRLLVQPPHQLASYREMSEGLEYRIKKALTALGSEATVERLLETMKTKRYTRTKLQRLLTSVYLEHRSSDMQAEILHRGVPYLRVLGFSETGRMLLHRMKRTAKVPVVTDLGRELHPLLALDVSATAAYAGGYAAPGSRDWLADYYFPPVRVSFGGSASK